jgi:hypothetical protein
MDAIRINSNENVGIPGFFVYDVGGIDVLMPDMGDKDKSDKNAMKVYINRVFNSIQGKSGTSTNDQKKMLTKLLDLEVNDDYMFISNVPIALIENKTDLVSQSNSHPKYVPLFKVLEPRFSQFGKLYKGSISWVVIFRFGNKTLWGDVDMPSETARKITTEFPHFDALSKHPIFGAPISDTLIGIFATHYNRGKFIGYENTQIQVEFDVK